MAVTVKQDCVIGLIYELRDGQGRVLEMRTADDPLYFIFGRQQILPAVEAALVGKQVGDHAVVTVSAADGYGEYDPELLVELPREKFPADLVMQLGMKFNTVGPSGKMVTVRVVNMEGDRVTIDGNHPLAGRELRFDFHVHSIREATPDELRGGSGSRGESPSLH